MTCSTQSHLPYSSHWMDLCVSCLLDKAHATGFGGSLMEPREDGRIGRTSQTYFSVDQVISAL